MVLLSLFSSFSLFNFSTEIRDAFLFYKMFHKDFGKSLQAFHIIIAKKVDLLAVSVCVDAETYNKGDHPHLTEYEFNMIKGRM